MFKISSILSIYSNHHHMKITKLDLVQGAKDARGITVVIDVFRAFSTACYAFANGASTIIAVGEIDKAKQIKSDNPDVILIGERGGKKLEGFEYGNSPTEIKSLDFQGKHLVLTTHSGTQGLVNAVSAEKLFTGSFVNAKATANYIRSLAPSQVSLVRMGVAATHRADEDHLCAEYLESLLSGKPFEIDQVKTTLRKSPCSDRFFDPAKPWSPPSDFDFCLEVDRFNFVIQAQPNTDGTVTLTPIPG